MTGSLPGHWQSALWIPTCIKERDCRVHLQYVSAFVFLGNVKRFMFSFVISCLCALMCVCVGKVAVKKEDLQKYHGKDTWFQLQPVSADSEVQVSTERKHTHTRSRNHTFEKQSAPSRSVLLYQYKLQVLYFSASPQRTHGTRYRPKRVCLIPIAGTECLFTLVIFTLNFEAFCTTSCV